MKGQAQIIAVEAAVVAQKQERGDAQQAIHERDAALLAMDRWYSDFIKIARVALAEQPQQLEKLGISVRA